MNLFENLQLYKEELNTAFAIDGNHIEVFKNPTDREILDTKISSNYFAVRGVIDTNEDVYIWPGDYTHVLAYKYVKNNVIINSNFRFHVDKNYWHFNNVNINKEFTLEEICKNIIKYKNILKRIGDINKTMQIWHMGKSKNEDYNIDIMTYFDNGINDIKYFLQTGKKLRNDD